MSFARRVTLLALTASVALAGCVSDVNRVLNVTPPATNTTNDAANDATISGAAPMAIALGEGQKHADLCGRVVISECGSEKVGVPQVHLTAKTSGGGFTALATTDDNGYYCFLGLVVGDWSVCVDPATAPAGATLVSTTFPSDGPNCQLVPLRGEVTNAHFFYERCGEPPPGECTIQGSIHSGFNGTAVVGASSGPAYIWFNSNFSLKNVKAGSHVTLTDARVIIDGVPHDVPDAIITFSAVGCASTTFDTGNNRWLTTVPVAGSDEIFLSGLAFPVTNLPGGAKVTWEGTFGTDVPGICISWKWGAAAYKWWPTNGSAIDYNAANIKAAHSGACTGNGGDHAGTPENTAVKKSVTGGARGGGGSNFTGSWSGTGSLCPPCAK